MNITKIHVDGFGKLKDFDLELKEGVNLITGPNEAGKSTMHLFLRSMFYGADKKRRGGRRPVIDRMRPWKDPKVYGGYIEVTDGEESWRILRNFAVDADDLKILRLNAGAGEEVPAEEAPQLMEKLLHGLSETAFVNTVSSGQLSSATERDMAAELRKYAANVTSTASPELNAGLAIARLQGRRALLERQMDSEAAREYTGLISSSRKLEEELAQPENDNCILSMTDAEKSAREAVRAAEARLKETETIIGQKKDLLDRFGCPDSTVIDQNRDGVMKDHGIYRALKAKTEKQSPLAPVLLFAAAAIVAALAWKFRREYLLVMLVIGAAFLVVCGLLVLLRQSGDRRKVQELEKSLRKRLSTITGREEISEDNLHRFESRSFELKRAAEDLAAARTTEAAQKEELSRLTEEQHASREGLEEQRRARNRVEAGIRELNSMEAEAARLKKKISENDRISEEIEAVDLAIETLEKLQEEIRDSVGTYVNREASRMVAGLTGGAYTSVNAGRQYDITLNSRDGMISIQDVSAGTADQVYLAMRLATIRFITGEEDAIPLILDDSFTLYDDERLLRALKFIIDNYSGQILIFSCQKREAEALREEQLPFNAVQIG